MTGKRARRIGTAIVALAAGAGLLTGCVSAFIPVRPADPAPVTDGVPDELLDFYDQPPEWSDCGENLEVRDHHRAAGLG